MSSCSWLVFLLLTLHTCSGANILIADSVPSPSHQIFNYAIADILLERGHNVTMLGPTSSIPTIVHKNYTFIQLKGIHEEVMKAFDKFPNAEENTLTELITLFLTYSETSCIHSYRAEGTRTLLNYPRDYKFDAIIIDVTNEVCYLPLIQRFGYPPTIGMTAFLLAPYLAEMMGTAIQPAYIPNYYTTSTRDMSFFDRLVNHFVYRYEKWLRWRRLMPAIHEEAMKTFGKDVATADSLQDHISILLANWNPAMHHPQPISPNIIPVAGAHIKLKPTDKDIQKILDNAKDGVVLFSLGSNLRSADLTPEARKEILEALGKVNATILWKFEEDITGLPKNVIVRKWIPQNNVLNHPNTRLFISHGGGLSTIEATYFGVPVLGMPFFADQNNNVDLLVNKDVARKISSKNLKADNFLENINELLNNPKYREGMKQLSMRFKDQPNSPRERVAFWVEYVIRHNGALFLSPKSRYLPVIVSSCTDIYLFLVGVAAAVLFAACRIKKFLFPSGDKKKQKTN